MKPLIIFLSFFTFFSFKIYSQNQMFNYYSFYKHKSDLNELYIKKHLNFPDICVKNVCGSNLVSKANATSFIESITYYLLVATVHNSKLNSDFFILSTYDRVSNRLLDKILLKKYYKQTQKNQEIFYTIGKLNLDEEKPSNFEISYSEEEDVISTLETNMPIIKILDTKVEKYKISLAGKFVKDKLTETAKDYIIYNPTAESNKIGKYVLFKNEILAKYKFNFNDKKLNDFFTNKVTGYVPLYNQEQIFFSEKDKKIINFLEDRINSLALQKPAEKQNPVEKIIPIKKNIPKKSIK